MTDAHCHVSAGDPSVREFLIGRDFVGVHPWDSASADCAATCASLRAALAAGVARGVGEIGLDRLRERDISETMRAIFEAQLAVAAACGCPVVLHGAKCWGQVVAAVRRLPSRPTGLLFHGFSRSAGLIADIAALGGFISVGPAVLNDHAVNYRELVKAIPDSCLLVETDRTEDGGVSVREVLEKAAALRGVTSAALEALTDANATRFMTGGAA